MSEIIPTVIEYKNELLGSNLQSVSGEELEDIAMKFLHLRESEIFIACGWNLNLPTGLDVLRSLLKSSNDSYNFSPLMTIINNMALDYIFQVLPSRRFNIVGPCQSVVYGCMLQAVCHTLNWVDFAD